MSGGLLARMENWKYEVSMVSLVWTSDAYSLGRDSFVLGWSGLDFYKKIDKIRPLAAGQRRHCGRHSPPYSSPCLLRCLSPSA